MSRAHLMAASAAGALANLAAAKEPRQRGRIVRADSDEDDEKEREDAARRADEALKTMIADAVAGAVKPAMDAAEKCMDAAEKCMDRMDAMGARMDAMEEETRDDKRKDGEIAPEGTKIDAKKDGEEEMEGKGKPEPAVDRKKDGEEKPEEEKHADADVIVLRREMAALQERLARQEAITPIPMTDRDSHALLERQALADAVFTQLGERAPPPQINEALPTYRRRILRGLSKYSDALKDTSWDAINDDRALSHLENQVYADAVKWASSPESVPAGHLIPLTERTSSGHTVTKYRGDSSTWMLPMAGVVTQQVSGFEGL
jgi:hypothetical protein